jgi:hypothetical protein
MSRVAPAPVRRDGVADRDENESRWSSFTVQLLEQSFGIQQVIQVHGVQRVARQVSARRTGKVG